MTSNDGKATVTVPGFGTLRDGSRVTLSVDGRPRVQFEVVVIDEDTDRA